MASFLGLPQDRLQTDNFYRDLDLESILSPEEPKRKRQRTDLGERLASFNATECMIFVCSLSHLDLSFIPSVLSKRQTV